jgi:DUF4097 and DUF4098 domain-containing protein YvlB
MTRSGARQGALAILLLAAVLAFGADRKFDKSFTVKPGGMLKVNTDVGTIHVTADDGATVRVNADLRGREADVQDFELTAEQSGNDVEVRGRGRKSGFWHNVDLDITYTITVPRDFKADLKTSGGDITITGTRGEVHGETSGGDLIVRDISGAVEAKTSGGDVEGTNISGNIHMSTSGGDIRVRGVTGEVEVSTSGGNVSVMEIKGKVFAGTSGGNVTVSVSDNYQGITAETSGGNVDIAISKKVGAEIDASTSGGDVDCDIPVTVSGKISETRIHGTINGGGNLLKARTSGGNIRIRAIP